MSNDSDSTIPTLMIDTNVANEFVLAKDFERAVKAGAMSWGLISPEYRRLRARGTLWFAMVLDAERRTTLTLQSELRSYTDLNAPPGSHEHGWLYLVVFQLVCKYICPGWRFAALQKDAGSNNKNDALIAAEAQARGIATVTRDAGVVKRVLRQGGKAFLPEEYAASSSCGLTLPDARRRFFERFDAHSASFARA